MAQPVKVSDELVLDARLTGQLLKRSIAGQIEFWAVLGRAIEPLLEGVQVLALQRAGKARPLSACLQSVGTGRGRRRLADPPRSCPPQPAIPVDRAHRRPGESGHQARAQNSQAQVRREDRRDAQKPPHRRASVHP